MYNVGNQIGIFSIKFIESNIMSNIDNIFNFILLCIWTQYLFMRIYIVNYLTVFSFSFQSQIVFFAKVKYHDVLTLYIDNTLRNQ
jgi:hypothetical protein